MRRRFFRPNSLIAGFTLIELLVVIVILGILMAVAVPTFLKQQTKAQDSRTQQYLTTAYEAIRSGIPETGNLYPSSTSLVSWVQQSEPELTVQRAGCYTGTATAPAEAVLVDPSSSANSLLLCSRSASGNVWELSATAASAPTLVNGTLVPLTFSGNEITDSMRASDIQGDGHAAPDSSTGIWEGTTNVVANGGFETNTAGWNIVGSYGGVYSRDTSTAKFGTASMNVTRSSGQTGFVGFEQLAYSAVVAGQVWTASAWLLPSSAAPASHLRLEVAENGGTTFSTTASSSDYVDASGWRHVSLTFTVDPGITQARIEIYDTTSSDVGSFSADGVQLEQNAISTPYVDTNGAPASRSAARIQAPASLLNATQGWVSMRVRLGPNPGGAHTWRAFEWGDDINNRIAGNVSSGTQRQMQMYRIGGGINAGSIAGPTFTWTQGAIHTFVFAWTANDLEVSLDGAAFTHLGAAGSIPTISSSQFDIGHSVFNGAGWIDSDVLWFACGVGALSDSDTASNNSIGNSDPTRGSFPSAAQVTMTWDGTSNTGSLK